MIPSGTKIVISRLPTKNQTPARIQQDLPVKALQIFVALRAIVLRKALPPAIFGKLLELRSAQRLGRRGAVVVAQKDEHFPCYAGSHALCQALLVDRQTRLPFFYREYEGNRHDSRLFQSIIDEVCTTMRDCGQKDVTIV